MNLSSILITRPPISHPFLTSAINVNEWLVLRRGRLNPVERVPVTLWIQRWMGSDINSRRSARSIVTVITELCQFRDREQILSGFVGKIPVFMNLTYFKVLSHISCLRCLKETNHCRVPDGCCVTRSVLSLCRVAFRPCLCARRPLVDALGALPRIPEIGENS